MKVTKEMLLEELEVKNEEIKSLKKDIQKLERFKQYADAADEMRGLCDAFVNSGFTEEQSFELLKTMMKSMIPTLPR